MKWVIIGGVFLMSLKMFDCRAVCVCCYVVSFVVLVRCRIGSLMRG